MKKMNIVCYYLNEGVPEGNIYVFNVSDNYTKEDVVNKCGEVALNFAVKNYADEEGYIALPSYDWNVGDILSLVTEDINCERELAMRNIEFVECLSGVDFVDNDLIMLTEEGDLYTI